MTSAPADKAHGKLWEGAETAQQTFGDLGGHRPALLAIHDAGDADTGYRTELSEHLDHPVISTDPILRHRPELPHGWWPALYGEPPSVPTRLLSRRPVLGGHHPPSTYGR
jgi:hypothetical protein